MSRKSRNPEPTIEETVAAPTLAIEGMTIAVK